MRFSGVVESPLALALGNQDCHPDLVELLLQDVGSNDHEGQYDTIPLVFTIIKCKHNQNGINILQLLLEYGAALNVSGEKAFNTIWKDSPLPEFLVMLKGRPSTGLLVRRKACPLSE